MRRNTYKILVIRNEGFRLVVQSLLSVHLKTYFMRTILIFISLLILACNSSQKTNSASDLVNSLTLDSIKNCSCKDSFYAVILDSGTIENWIDSNHHRFRFDFYETKNGCFNSFKIEGWHQVSVTDTSISITLSPDNKLVAQSFNAPYHFRDIEISMKDIKKLIDSIPNTHPRKCDYKIQLTPFQDLKNNCLNIKAQIFYDCDIDATTIYTPGASKTLNPCPPNKPQG